MTQGIAKMNLGFKLVIVGTVLAILTAMITLSEADDLPFDILDCKKIMARIAKKTLKAFGKCTKELKANVSEDKDLFQKKLGCAVKCTLRGIELLDDEGKVTRDKIQKFMDVNIPQDAHEFAHALTADCNESVGALLDPNQEFCESYAEYAKCMQNTLADFADKTSCHPGGPH